MKGKKLLFIVNPNAGNNRIKNSALKILDNFIKAGFDVTFYSTQKKGDACNITQNFGKDFSTIVCCGGDGTLNETINGVLKSGIDVELGYIPCGTTNDFAYNYKLYSNNVRAGLAIAKGSPQPLDIGIINDRAFAYVAAFGAFTEIPYQTPQKSKAAFGKLAYYSEAVKKLPHINSVRATVTCGDVTFEEDLIYGMISNSLHVGGFKMSDIMKNLKNISLHDGKLEALFVVKPKNITEFQSIANSFLLSDDSKFVRSFQADSIKLHFDTPTPWTLDGEFGGEYSDVEFRVVSGKVVLLK